MGSAADAWRSRPPARSSPCFLYAGAGWVRPRYLPAITALGTVLVTAHVWSAEHEPALSGEMLYIWLGLYAAYFFSTRQAAAQLAFMAGAYLGGPRSPPPR